MKLLKLLKLKVCLWEEFHAWPLGGSNRGLGFMVSLLCKSKKHLSIFILLVSESIKKHPERNQVSPRLLQGFLIWVLHCKEKQEDALDERMSRMNG